MREFSEGQLSAYLRFSEDMHSTNDSSRRREILIDYLRQLAQSANVFADKAMRTLVKLQDFCISKIEHDGERQFMEVSSALSQEVDQLSYILQQCNFERLVSEGETRRKLEQDKVAFEASTREELVKCRICKQNTRNAVILPCMHAQFCNECLEAKSTGNNKNCSICGGHIRSILNYIA
ncbi:hypothetical protein KP509_30G038500 [Ceratopteris richardii]|nr:hypothetical protein KP509_30G038500 [Ceratopteris richardii]